ncbi:sperm acrosome membrane-associated protein 6 [Centrocercus urophasianus]|uniref:sperm acrosome membrane-associated protein 6 n=1 Tax=Centrocercus urophasianus TaxID=9002 RepID=UPI001C648655|nr:sperm acrosome membrane-associated protein 6 [Centrocercus urophasianus]
MKMRKRERLHFQKPHARVPPSPREVTRAPGPHLGTPVAWAPRQAVLCSETMERRWLPLLLLLVPWLPGLHPCLLCFGPPVQWARLCREMARSSQDSQHQHCLEALAEAAVPLAPVTVGAAQSEALRKIVMDALHLLEKQKDKKPFEVSLREAIQMIWVKLSQLEQAPACIPPCGHQPAARIFQCSTCRLVDCQFPVDCPVQDLWVHEDEAITLHCDVPFAVPPELQVTWMFAKDIRTQDLALFEELQRGVGEPPSLTVQDPTLGTVACRLGAASETLARKYFYLNVSGGSVEAEQGLQARFRAVLRWPQGRAPVHLTTSLQLGLVLGFVSLVLLLLLLSVWRCCRKSPEPPRPQ